jgi:hypothetical protein
MRTRAFLSVALALCASSPVPGNCTRATFLAAWRTHQARIEGEGQGGGAFSYHAAW